MAIVTITEAAKLSNKSTQTLYRHIKAGKLSKHSNGGIDTAELIRCYGELSQSAPVQNVMTSHSVIQQNNGNITTILQNQIDFLKQEIATIRADAIEQRKEFLEREKKLMALLEHKKEMGGGLFGKLFK